MQKVRIEKIETLFPWRKLLRIKKTSYTHAQSAPADRATDARCFHERSCNYAFPLQLTAALASPNCCFHSAVIFDGKIMSTRKVLLCLLCKLPVADGAVASDQVDKKKLRHWYYFVCERKLELKVDDQGSICHYCIWQAEFLREVDSVIKVKTPAWWPQTFDSKGIVKVQRDLFFEGKLNQCWVKMMDFRLLAPQKAATRQEKMKCFFCGKMKYDLFSHLEKKHQNSLNCEIKKCNKYFRTKAEKEMHNEQKHSKGEMRSTYKCDFCPRVTLPDPICFNYHVRKSHADINLKKCPMWNCTFFSKVEGLVDAHFEAAHAIAELGDVFRCHFCEFKSNVLSDLQEHIEGKHMTVKVPFDVCTQTDLKLKSCGVCNRHV